MKTNQGTAGLTILLSLVVTLFVIGLLVMIFAIMSGRLANTDTLYYTSSSIVVGNESTTPTTAGALLTNGAKRGAVCTLMQVYNGTTLLAIGNITEVSECTVRNNSVYTAWKITYSYVYEADSSGAVNVINDTSSAVASVTDWFDIFIVIGAMVVLILLTVIIITSIQRSGLVAGGTMQNGANVVGSA